MQIRKLLSCSVAAVACAVVTVLMQGSVASAAGVAINEQNFPDPVFRSYVSSNFDVNVKDGILDSAELTVYSMNCAGTQAQNKGIKSLKGIEYFPSLEKLYCSYNQLTELDLTRNTNLEIVECRNNNLKRLDVGANARFQRLYCSGNRLQMVDVRSCPNLLLAYTEGYKFVGEGSVTYGYSPSEFVRIWYDLEVDESVYVVTEEIPYEAMYRLYNPNSGEHFYTASLEERDTLTGYGWNYEGVAWSSPKVSNVPIYRLFNPNTGDHHYTGSDEEKDNLVNVGWNYEGVGWYSDENLGRPIYRLFNPNATTGSHHYTTSAVERDNLVNVGWNYEGICCYCQ